MRILFISRSFPPVVGGIEKQNHEIYQALSKRTKVVAVINRHGKLFLPFFICIALIETMRKRKQYDVLLLGDGVLAVIAFVFKFFSRKPVISILHGLDVTYSNILYRTVWLRFFFQAVDHFIAVGNETVRQAQKRGVAETNLSFIPNGVNAGLPIPQHSREELSRLLGFPAAGYVLLTLGRLVKRKGVVWFIEHVMPLLDENVVYLVAGKGPEENRIRRAITESPAAERIVFLGTVTDEEKELLLTTADLFIQPNIPVKNDMEGFGLVVLEAAMHGTYVLASRLEGLQDAIVDDCNGNLVEAGDAQAYRYNIGQLLSNADDLREKSSRGRDFVMNNYDWDQIAQQYLRVIKACVDNPVDV